MKRVNFEDRIQKLNEFCQKESSKSFSGEELSLALRQLGFSKTVAGNIANKYFPYEKQGTNRLYTCPKSPIYIGQLKAIYGNMRKNSTKPQSSQKSAVLDAWQTLLDSGIVKRKFNLETLKTKYPAIYLECLEYEIIK